MIKRTIHRSCRAFGLEIARYRQQQTEYPPDFQSEDMEIIQSVLPSTMTSVERIYALIQAVRYLTANAIFGAIVECGVWKGGSMATVAMTLLKAEDVKRDLFLFDTFEGMTAPTSRDLDYGDRSARELMMEESRYKCADARVEDVKQLLYGTGYPRNRIHFIKGAVEETIPAASPDAISLLRLDTDWYESTKHELVHLFPRLCRGGVILLDDYGHWKGARQACDEYFKANRIPILLNRIDYTGRIAVKA